MMNDIKINGAAGAALPQATGAAKPAEGFDNAMNEALAKISQVQTDADQAVQQLSSGSATEAIISMEKADMNFQLMIEVRNKLISAYQEVMRMQV
jgi:flagellar hook-basal body complex protein FliE